MTERHKNDRSVRISPVNVQPLFSTESECFADIEDKPQLWLWEDHIPYSAFTLIAGYPGVGKSQFLIYLAAMVSKGEPITVNAKTYPIEKGSVIILHGEDNKNTSISPRLTVLNADKTKIHRIKTVTSGLKSRLIELDEDYHLLEQLVKDLGDVRLIIIDPITSFLGKTKDHVDSAVRNFLNILTELAEKHKIAIILNKHLRKGNGSGGVKNAIEEVSGSGAWVAVARQSFIIAEHPGDPEQVVLANLKVNIAKKMRQAYPYKIVSDIYLNKDGETIKTSHMEWLSGVVSIDASEAIDKVSFEKNKKGNAIKFILDHLTIEGSTRGDELRDKCVPSIISKSDFYDVLNKLVDDDLIRKERGFGKAFIYSLGKKLVE